MDRIAYINIGQSDDVLYSRLRRLLVELKQQRAKPQQWIGTIQGLTQKGVKQSEIDDTTIVEYLKCQESDVAVEKQRLLKCIDSRQPVIKRVDLGAPVFRSYVSMGGAYTERLYILSSEVMRADDEIEDLIFQIEELGFNPSRLLSDPGLVDRIEARMAHLRSHRPEMYDFKDHHHSLIIDKYGKNLMAHSRFVRQNGLFFIQEVQSDWAQRGRHNDWSCGYPRAPFVTNTEQWAGVVVRDLLHTAANDPACQQVAWIRSTMRNGGQCSSSQEYDDLSVFYDDIVRKLVEKALGKVARPTVRIVETKNGPADVLGFDMTDAVRKNLSNALPLYSRDAILRGVDLLRLEDPERTQERRAVVNECETMLGDARTIRFVSKLYDVSRGVEVAGKYLHAGLGACINPSISVSLRANNLDRVARHEMWHFAHENFLFDHERRMMRMEFSPGTALNERTRQTLLSMGLDDAARQCQDHRECAAHAFSLWCEGRLDVEEKPRGIFWAALKAVERTVNWLSEKYFQTHIHTVDDLFKAMRTGALQARSQHISSTSETDDAAGTESPRG